DLPSRAIAAELAKRAIPTPRGGDWRLAIDDRDALTSTPRAALIVAIDRGFELPARKTFSAGPGRHAAQVGRPRGVPARQTGTEYFDQRDPRSGKHIYLDALACRTCLHLDYSSRHLHRSVPGVHRIMRWRRMIGIDPHPFAAIPERPEHHTR